VIATDAINMIPGVELSACRKPDIVADAAVHILQQVFSAASGRFYIDEAVLREAGVTDFDAYAVEPGKRLLPDLFL
jgi:citronellol/citronellal dehydrogenase